MIPKATKSYAMEDPAPGEGPAAGGEALRIYYILYVYVMYILKTNFNRLNWL